MRNFGYMNGYLTDNSTTRESTPFASIPSTPGSSNQIDSDNEDELPRQSVNDGGRVDEVFVVEKILGKRFLDGVIQYKIKWKDYDNPEEDTWEDIDNVHCLDLIKEYEDEHKNDKVEAFLTKQNKTRGRKRKASEILTNGTSSKKADESPRQIPLVEKESYFLDEKDVKLDTILGLSILPTNANKIMALVCYFDTRIEYIPVDLLRKNEIGKEQLLDILLNRVQFVD